MNLIEQLARQSGFKVLAMARLSQVESSIVLYLINCAASGLKEVITTESELSSLIGHPEQVVRDGITSLSEQNMVDVRYGAPHKNRDIESIRIGLVYKVGTWRLERDDELSANDALVFPFRRQGKAELHVLKEEAPPEKTDLEAWQRIFNSFVQGRTLDEDDIERTENTSRVLIETHPVDQVLLMIRHFRGRIPTLSLLASSWQHYQEMFEEETQKVDLLGARQKHLELDQKLRGAAKDLLSSDVVSELTEEELTVVKILSTHRHPRRQLFWAYQSRSRYPGLAAFFTDNQELMLAVTNSGKVLWHQREED